MNTLWGATISSDQPFTFPPQNPPRRLRITQATIMYKCSVTGRAWTTSSAVRCSVGGRPPIYLCALEKNSKSLDFEIEESEDVVFSVVGPRPVYLAGYFLRDTQVNHNTQIDTHGEDNINNIEIETKRNDSIGANELSEGFIDGRTLIISPNPSEIGAKIDDLNNDKDMSCNHVDKSTGSSSEVLQQQCFAFERSNDARKEAVAQIYEMIGNEDSHNKIVAVSQEENLANSIISVSSEYEAVVPNSDESRRDDQTSEFPMPLTIVCPVDTWNPILKYNELTMKKIDLSDCRVDDRALMICSNPSEIGARINDFNNDKDMSSDHVDKSTSSSRVVSQQQCIAFERTNDVRKNAVTQIDDMVENEDVYNKSVAVLREENLANSIISVASDYEVAVPNSDESKRDLRTSEFPMPLTIVWPVDTLNPILKNNEFTMKKFALSDSSVDDRSLMICPNFSEIGGMVDDLDNDKDIGCSHHVNSTESSIDVSQQQCIAFERANDVRKAEAIARGDEMDENEDGYNNTVAAGQDEDVELTNHIISIVREYEVTMPYSVESDEFGPGVADELKNKKRKMKTEPIGCRKAKASDADQNLSASMTHDQDYDVSIPSTVLEAGCSDQKEKKKSKRTKESKVNGENAGKIQNQVTKSSLFEETRKLEDGKVELGRTMTHDKLQDVFVSSTVIEAGCCENLEKKKSKRRQKESKFIKDNFQGNENCDKDNGMPLEVENDRCTNENVIADEHSECGGQKEKKISKRRNEGSKIIGENAGEIQNQETKTLLLKEMGLLEDGKVELGKTKTHEKLQDVFVPSTAIEACCEKMEKKKSKRQHKELKIVEGNFQENENQVKDKGTRLKYEDDRCIDEIVVTDEHLECSGKQEKKKSKRRNKESKIIGENAGEIHNEVTTTNGNLQDVFVPKTAIETGCCEKMEKKRSKRRHKESKIIVDNSNENENQVKDNGMLLEDGNDRHDIDSSVLDEKRKLKKRKVEATSSTMHDQLEVISHGYKKDDYARFTNRGVIVGEQVGKSRDKQQFTISSDFGEKGGLKEKKVGEGMIHKKSSENDNSSRKIVLALRASSDSNTKSSSQRFVWLSGAVTDSSAPKKVKPKMTKAELQRMSKVSDEKNCTSGNTDLETALESHNERIVPMDASNVPKLKKSKSKKSKSRKHETDEKFKFVSVPELRD